ncbi:MAG: DUF2911 domain-containing protein [Gemmatimonadota bacterium]
MWKRTLVALGVAVALQGALAPEGAAQIRASEHGVVAQTADGTTVTVEYSRPSARGRDLFGALVPWGGVWTPGANWATTFEVDNDIRMNGAEIPAGKYTVWAIPREESWSIILNDDPEIFHFVKPDSAAGVVAVSAVPETGEHVEMLTWSFPVVRGDAMQLRLQWGTTSILMDISVPPTVPEMTAEERATYVGSYEISIAPGMGWPDGVMEVFEMNGKLRGRLPFGIHPEDEPEFDMVPAGSHRFSPGLYRDGEFFSVETGVAFEFEVRGEKASAVVLRGGNGAEFGTGTRVE